MFGLIDRLLNRITMYRLVLYYLIVLLAVAVIFGAFHILPYDPLSLILSTLIILLVCWIVNALAADLLRAKPNFESVYITALILALIITPISFHPLDYSGLFFIMFASAFAIASKYILAINKKHIFNPAAIAVVLTGFILGQYASWWVGGNIPLLAFVVIGGLIVVRKIQRFDLVLPFFAAAVVSIIVSKSFADPFGTLVRTALHTPIFFVAFIMLTEPATTPPRRALRIAYGALVGLLYAPAVHLGPIYSTPELALVVGNIFSYAVSPKGKKIFALKEKREMGTDLYDFTFTDESAGSEGTGGSGLKFQPGQYMEWTLGGVPLDGRGNRRYFTIASSPTESDLKIGVKYYEPSSSFKKKLLRMEPGEKISGGQLAGDFTMPKDPRTKLAFIAGGIGITPFRSMAKYLSDRGEKRDVVLLYSNRKAEEISYREVFDEAGRKIGLRAVYAITGTGQTFPAENGHRGRIDENLIKKTMPDYRERMFYISGTHAMVSAMEKMLREMGVPRRHIKTDFFPGFV